MWEDFLESALDYLRSRQERLESEFELGRWQQYHYDQDAGTITFSSNGDIGVVADIHVVGSLSNRSKTWLWSWENDSIVEAVKRRMLEVRRYGAEHGFDKLTTPKWPADEVDGWEMTAVAAFLLRAEGAYRAPDGNGALFMVLDRVRMYSGGQSLDTTAPGAIPGDA